MKTKVVNIRNEKCDIFIGRHKEVHLHFGNPYIMGKDGSRKEVIDKFELWLKLKIDKQFRPGQRRYILSNLSTLKGKTLGCFCKPLPCHGDVLAKMADET